ncbi:hypothetical protein D9M68_731860 [compost metagenome]
MAALDRALEPERRQQHDERRRQEEDQSFQAGGDIAQAQEVQEAGQVVAQEPQHADLQALLARQGDDLAARGAARLVPGHGREERHGEQHAEGDEGDRVNAVAVGEFDDDGLGGKQDRAEGRQEETGRAAGGTKERRKLGKAIHAMILCSVQK